MNRKTRCGGGREKEARNRQPGPRAWVLGSSGQTKQLQIRIRITPDALRSQLLSTIKLQSQEQTVLCCFASLCISAPASHSQGQWRPRSPLTRGRGNEVHKRMSPFVFLFLAEAHNRVLCIVNVFMGSKLLDLSSWRRAGAQRSSTKSSGSQLANQESACITSWRKPALGGVGWRMSQEPLCCQPRTQDHPSGRQQPA